MLEEYWHCARRDENVMEDKESVPLGEIALTVTPPHTPPDAYIICLIFVICYLLFVICYLLFVICYLFFFSLQSQAGTGKEHKKALSFQNCPQFSYFLEVSYFAVIGGKK